MTGRAEELRSIAETLAGGAVAGVVLAGTAGVGKSRLALEALRTAGVQGPRGPRWTVATAASRVLPLGVFSDLVATVPGAAPNPGLLERVCRSLAQGPPGQQVVIGIDDAHLLDNLSAAVVHQLAARRAARLVVTIRGREPAPDAVTALWKDGHLRRLEIQPLSREEATALLEAALGAQIETIAVDKLWATSQGNPLFLRHLVDGALESGSLRLDHEVWRLTQPYLVAPALEDLRIGAISDAVRDVVDLLALGEPLGVGLLGELVGHDAIEEAEQDRLVTVETDGRRLQARLAHPLYAESRRANIASPRARRLRGQLSAALTATGARRADDLLRGAIFMIDSDIDHDPALLTASADRATHLGDLPLASQLGAAGVQAGGGFAAQGLVANAAVLLGLPSAEDELVTLSELADTDDQLVAAAVHRAIFLVFTLARPDDSLDVLAAAQARVAGPSAPPLAALRSVIDALVGRPEQAEQAALTVLATDDPTDDTVLMASYGLVAARAITGRVDEIQQPLARGLDAADRSLARSSLWVPMIVVQVHGLRLAGYLDEAVAVAADLREQTKELALGAEIGCYLMGDAELGRGRLTSALRWLREARAGVEQYGDAGGWRFATLITLTHALALTGDLTAARRALADLDRHQHAGLAMMYSEMILAKARVVAAEGAISEAIALAHEAADLAAERGQLAHEVLALQAAVRLGDRGVAGRLAILASRVDGPRAALAGAHAAALAAVDADALLAVSASLEGIGDLLAAADAAGQAAVLHTQAGRRSTAAGARAHGLAEACGGALTPAVLAATRPLPLTEREREIVSLAASGLSNRQIAQRFVVSVRTVEGHLYRAAGKLGVTDRSEFAALLGFVRPHDAHED